ncbi:MAG TPA: hypothetical protein VF980_06225 [Thermoanaerobaculia bacterium]
MRQTLVVTLLILTITSAYAADRTRAVNRPVVETSHVTPIDGPWKIELTTSGGFGGGGTGDIRVDSDGNLTVGQFVTNGKSCRFVLLPGELAQLNTIVRSIQPDLWFGSYVPADSRQLCCDLVFTKVVLERTELVEGNSRPQTGHYETQFLETRRAPHDLMLLANVLAGGPDSLRSRYQPLCK